MTRRILSAIVLVAGLVIVGFGVPLGAAVRDLYREEAIAQLVREAARAGARVPFPIDSGDPIELPRPAHGIALGVYASDGRRVAGSGPLRGGREVELAATGRLVETEGAPLVVASPLSSAERVFAVVRAELSPAAVDSRVRRAWLFMTALAVGLLALAAAVGRALSGRIARPVADLASAASRLGHGDFTVRPDRSGIPELDEAAENLGLTADRLGRMLDRERAFSADASHQLRTPLTGLRLHLETALGNPTVDPRATMRVALGEVDRLEATIEDLLVLAREAQASRGPVDIAEVLAAVEHVWHGRLAASGRPLRVEIAAAPLIAHASRAAVSQILDVLIANAAQHGAGVVHVHAAHVGDGVVVEVSDDGPGPEGDPEAIFERRSGTGHGIGLSLARSLAHAEGGRLVLANSGAPTTFTLALRDSDPAGPDP